MPMYALFLAIDFRVPTSQSLKSKRSVTRSLVRRIDQLHGVGAAEVGSQNSWQRSQVSAAIVGADASQADTLADSVERLVWGEPQLEVVEIQRTWAEVEKPFSL